jgi:hypothetical protein
MKRCSECFGRMNIGGSSPIFCCEERVGKRLTGQLEDNTIVDRAFTKIRAAGVVWMSTLRISALPWEIS